MDHYNGTNGDTLKGGGKHVLLEGWGGEIYNFKNLDGYAYGYVQPVIDRKYGNPSTIKLEKLGGSPTDDKLDNVLVVWTAFDPGSGSTKIIGWHDNATVYRFEQHSPEGLNRKYKGVNLGYFTKAKFSDVKLIFHDARNKVVQRRKKNWMGQSNVWYADANPEFVQEVTKYISNGKTKTGGGRPRTSDPLKRIEVEKVAIQYVANYYEQLGYVVNSVEKDNVGWDLAAIDGKKLLKLEVKGLSGLEFIADLTPNEFEKMQANKDTYRLCLVTNVLVMPCMKIFSYSFEMNDWISQDGIKLNFKKIESARVFL